MSRSDHISEDPRRRKERQKDKCPACGRAFNNAKAMLFHYNNCTRTKRG